jgi:hypothetical protein
MVFQVGREDIFRFPPRPTIVAFTSGVGATGEKIRRELDVGRTIVARPLTFVLPNRENGKERVVRFGESARITMTSAGLDGMSFDVMAGDQGVRCRMTT